MVITGKDFVNILLPSATAYESLQEARRVHSTDTPYSERIVLRVATANGNGMDDGATVVAGDDSFTMTPPSSTEMDRSALKIPSPTS